MRLSGASKGRESSLGRAVIWLQVLVTIFVILSFAVESWHPSQGDMFNIVFVIALASVFVIGLALFIAHHLRMERRVAAVTGVILSGSLLVALSSLVYQNSGSEDLEFMAPVLVGTALTIAGVGLLVVKVRQSSRLAGYYSMWLFGMLLIMFMPLHELGSLDYSNRDLLVGYLGLGISLIGSSSFVIERRMVVGVEGWVTTGDAKYISGKFDEAVEYYEQALEMDPRNGLVWSSKGATLLKLGLWAKAIECFDRALESDGGLAIAHSGRGLALTQLKRYSEALDSHDRAIAIDASPVSWNNKGNTLMRMNAPAERGIECYRNALKLDPKYEVAWFNKGKAELMIEEVEASIESFTRAVELRPQFADAWFHKGRALAMSGGNNAEALYCFDTAIELNPANSEAWMERKVLLLAMKERKVRPIAIVNVPATGVVFGPAARDQPLLESEAVTKHEASIVATGEKLRQGALRLAAQGMYDKAIEALDARLAAAPEDVVTHMTRGVLLSRIERFDDALGSFDAAIRLKPEWVGPLFSKGMILASRGEYDASLEAMNSVIHKRPNYADAWSVKGIILGTQKKYDDAVECFDRVIELRPDDADAWRSRSTALNKLGRYEEAIQCYEKLATLSPAIEETQRMLLEEREKLEDAKTLFRQGVDLAKVKLYDEGLALLKNAIELRPNYVDALYISGVVNGVTGNYSESMQYFERVLALRPEHVEALYGKASILLKVGSPAKALDLLERVLRLNQDHVDAWCDRGVALTKMGKDTDALECYDRALKLAGDHPQAIALRERCVQAMKLAQDEMKGP